MPNPSKVEFSKYQHQGFYDEMFDEHGNIRDAYQKFKEHIQKLDWRKLTLLQNAADRAQYSMGMTFNVYSDKQAWSEFCR